jgi:hypothetical protein
MAETREEVLTPDEGGTPNEVEGSSRWTLAGDREPGGRNELPSVGVLWLVTASLAGTDASDSGLGRLSSAIAHSVTEKTAT